MHLELNATAELPPHDIQSPLFIARKDALLGDLRACDISLILRRCKHLQVQSVFSKFLRMTGQQAPTRISKEHHEVAQVQPLEKSGS